MRDLDLNGTPETCVQAYVGDNKGSCEGVDAMDNKSSASTSAIRRRRRANAIGVLKAAGLQRRGGAPALCELFGSDVAYSLCEPVVTGGVIQRPNVFEDTEQNVFVNGFAFDRQSGHRGGSRPRGKSTPGAALSRRRDCVSRT
jgi:hypothetical protein